MADLPAVPLMKKAVHIDVDAMMRKMAEERGRFDSRELLMAGVPGLDAVMDKLLPDTRAPKGAKASAKQLDGLIEELGNKSSPARQAAMARLIEAGLPAWLKLRAAAESVSESPERRSRAHAVLDSWRTGARNDASRYSDAFRTFTWGIREPACLLVLARRTKLALECGMPEFGRRDVVCGALRAASKFGDMQCMEILGSLVDSEDPNVAVFVLQTVGAELDGRALPRWFDKAATQSQRAAVATTALEWMGRAKSHAATRKSLESGGKPSIPSASDPAKASAPPLYASLIDRAADYEENDFCDAAGNLAYQFNSAAPEDLALRVLGLLHSPEPFVRSRIGQALARRGNQVILKALIPLLADTNATVADEIARALTDRDDLPQLDRALAAVINANAQDPDVIAAAQVLDKYVREMISAVRPLSTQPVTSPTATLIQTQAARASVPRPRLPRPASLWWKASPAYFRPSMFVADPVPTELQALMDPSLVTLHVKNATPRDVFELVAQQTGVRFDPIAPDYWQPVRSAPITINADRQPLWSVLLDLQSHTRIALRPHDRESIWLVMGNPEMSGRPLVQGPFLIYAAPNISDWSAAGVKRPGLQDLRLMLTLLSEPKTSVVACAGLKLDEAVDDQGHSLLAERVPGAPTTDDHQEMYATAGQDHFSFEAQFWRQLTEDGKGNGARLARLRGHLRVIVALRTQIVDVLSIDAANGHRYAIGGAQLLMGALNPADDFPGAWGGNRLMPFSVERTRPVPEEWVAQKRFLSTFRFDLFDDFGDELHTEGRNWPPLTIPGTQYVFGARPREMVLCSRPTRLRIESPTAVRAIDIPFEFADLPLPIPRAVQRATVSPSR